MMIQIFLQWLIPFACGALVSVCTALFTMRRKERKREKAVENGVQCLLRAEIIRQYEKWVDRGYCPIFCCYLNKNNYTINIKFFQYSEAGFFEVKSKKSYIRKIFSGLLNYVLGSADIICSQGQKRSKEMLL